MPVIPLRGRLKQEDLPGYLTITKSCLKKTKQTKNWNVNPHYPTPFLVKAVYLLLCTLRDYQFPIIYRGSAVNG
jgi:hypothetical protein